MSMILEFLPLVGMFVVGVGFWAIGQWLRRKGHGDALDRLAVRFVKVRQFSYRILGPVGGSMVGLGRGLSRVPVFGSKRTRAVWDVIEQTAEQKQDK